MPVNGQKENYTVATCPFSWDKLDGLLAYKSSLLVCSELLGVCERTVQNHIMQRHGLTFTEYAQRKLSKTKVKLVSKAIEMATSGNNTMMIFCLKNLCKWADRTEADITSKGESMNNPISVKNLSVDEIETLMKLLKKTESVK